MYTLSIDLGGTIIKIGILNDSQLVEVIKIKARRERGLKFNLPVIETEINKLMKKYQLSEDQIIGIGFSFPGLVDSIRNRVISTNKKYDDAVTIDLTEWAKKKFGLTLLIENDARMALLGEWQYGIYKNYENIVMVTLGTGIGTAVLIEGKLLKGRHFQAGNMGGHFVVNFLGSKCSCGNIGCMEAEVSTWKLPQLIKNNPAYLSSALKNERTLDYKALFHYVEKKDPVAKETLEYCIKVWSAGIVSLVHAYDPELIILGGGIMESAPAIIPAIQNNIRQFAWTPWGEVKINKAQFINDAAHYGADYLLRSTLFD